MSTVALTHFDTHNCRTWSCPQPALPGDLFCAHCRKIEDGKVLRPVVREDNISIHDAIMALVPLLGRYEIELERDPESLDYQIALHELKRGVARAARRTARLT